MADWGAVWVDLSRLLSSRLVLEKWTSCLQGSEVTVCAQCLHLIDLGAGRRRTALEAEP